MDIIRFNFGHLLWPCSNFSRQDGLRNSLPGFKKVSPCALIAFAKSIRMLRRSLELKAASFSVLENRNSDFDGGFISVEMISLMVRIRLDCGCNPWSFGERPWEWLVVVVRGGMTDVMGCGSVTLGATIGVRVVCDGGVVNGVDSPSLGDFDFGMVECMLNRTCFELRCSSVSVVLVCSNFVVFGYRLTRHFNALS